MIIARRTFLLGLASVIASPAVAKMEKFIGPMATGILDSRLGDRRISELVFSCMPTGHELSSPDWCEDPVQFSFFRNEEAIAHFMINPRASLRWVAAPFAEIDLRERGVFRMQVEPAHTHAALTIGSNIEMDREKRIRYFSECFHWEDGKTTLSSVTAHDYLDEHVLA